MSFRSDPKYGHGNYTIDASAVVLETATQFSERLSAHFASPGYTPPVLPAVALQVHTLAQRSDVDAAEVVAVMQKDPVVAGRVLKLAQSAAFAQRGTITSLRDAVVRLGMRNLSNLAWEVSLTMRVFRSKSYAEPMELVRRHSTAAAHLSRLVASFTAIPSEYAFLCGLLHDIGMAAALIVLGEQQETASGMEPKLLGDVLRLCHQAASGTVARLWKLPADVQLVLGHHHDVIIDGVVHPLTAIVAVAGKLARALGFGVVLAGRECDVTEPYALERAERALAFDPPRLDRLMVEAKKLLPRFQAEADSGSAPARDGKRPTR